MKKTLMFILVLIALGLLSNNAVFARDSHAISISCIIPAIPGVNAPLIAEETIKTKADASAEPEADSQETIPPQNPTLIEQDIQEERITSEGKECLVIVKTIYSR